MNIFSHKIVLGLATLALTTASAYAAVSLPLGYGGAPSTYGASFFAPAAPSYAVTAPATTPVTGKVLGATTFMFSQNLSFGSRGDDVTELQKMLARDGFFTVTPTGYFGPITRAALMKWQSANGIPSTGFFGLLSRMKANGSSF